MSDVQSHLTRIDAKDALIPRLLQARTLLINGLLGIQLEDGWADAHLDDKGFSTWTTIVTLTSLLRCDVIPENMMKALENLKSKKWSNDGYIGWDMDERFTQSISTYVTADALSLLLVIGDIDEAMLIVKSLQGMRNHDGGWGLYPGDGQSKVTSTCWVANSLLDAYEHPATKSIVNIGFIEQAVKWLYNAQNEYGDDYGWAHFPNTPPSYVGATSETLNLLLRIAEGYERHGVRRESLKRAVQTLKQMGVNGFWKGETEAFTIVFTNGMRFRHTTGGLGTLSAIMVMIRAVEFGLLSLQDYDLYLGIENILSRCKVYSDKPGGWITPSDQGGPPVIWNSAYALHVISDIERFYLNHEGEYVDTAIYKAIYTRANKWKRIAIVLLTAILFIFFTTYLKGFLPVLDWYSRLSPLLQGIIMIITAIVVEEVYRRLITPVSGIMKERFFKR